MSTEAGQAFRLHRPALGSGGFADTYCADVLDPKLKKKWGAEVVALKIPKDKQKELVLIRELVTTSLVNQALRELAGVANVVRYLDVELFDDKYVMVMEYVPGGSLRQLIGKLGQPRTPLPLEQVYDLLSGILRGLSAIHQARVFHRDIKPENILLSGATPKISDLGIATMLQTKEQASTTIGTLAYMSPEILGPEGASFSSDLWAVGVTAYEMLTGHWPFGDEETPVGPMVNMILTQEPAPPQQRVPSIPEAVGRVILKALHKDPAERYATPDAMRRDLDLAIRTAKRTVVAVPERPKPEAAPARAPEAHAGEAPDAELAALRAQAYSAQTAPETEAGLKDLARRFPKDARTHAALGEFYNRAMRYAQAVAALKKGLEHDPGNAMAHWHLGLALEKLGRRPEAAQALEAALKAGLDRKLEIHARVVLKHLTS